jgi:hypothetical protein
MGSSLRDDGDIIIGQLCGIAVHFVFLRLARPILDLLTNGLRLVFIGGVRIALAPSMTYLWMNRALGIVRDTPCALLHFLRLLNLQHSTCLEFAFIML